ncbi:hypothetical protein F4604DRAFT_1592223, partial [Suillus subluteus]
QFLEACIERQPDILLTEMQDQLRETCVVKVLIATISRTIHRRGELLDGHAIFLLHL